VFLLGSLGLCSMLQTMRNIMRSVVCILCFMVV